MLKNIELGILLLESTKQNSPEISYHSNTRHFASLLERLSSQNGIVGTIELLTLGVESVLAAIEKCDERLVIDRSIIAALQDFKSKTKELLENYLQRVNNL